MTWGFKVGKTYNRRQDVHGSFGGQQQGGIITPKEHNLILIVTGDAGGQHGYEDGLRRDGVFEYFGEGQMGDMVMQRGNKAVFEHTERGKDLLLFRKTKDGLRFEGQYVVEGLMERMAPDTEGTLRKAFVFEMRPLEAIVEDVAETPLRARTTSLDVLRNRAFSAAKISPRQNKNSSRTIFERSRVIRDYIHARAKGKCEYCDEIAPFHTPSGAPFLEVHHIRRMSDGGPDDPRFMIGLCPNCHRRVHFGADAEVRNQEMQNYVRLIEESEPVGGH